MLVCTLPAVVQAQNEQLKMQCSLLTEELSKLRMTFDAILKAGDNLQADYDQLQAEKDKLHDQLEGLAREKEEVSHCLVILHFGLPVQTAGIILPG